MQTREIMLIHEKIAMKEWNKKFTEQSAFNPEEGGWSPEISQTISPVFHDHVKKRSASVNHDVIISHKTFQRRKSTSSIFLDPAVKAMKLSNHQFIEGLFPCKQHPPSWDDVKSQFSFSNIQGGFDSRMEFIRMWTIYALNDKERLDT